MLKDLLRRFVPGTGPAPIPARDLSARGCGTAVAGAPVSGEGAASSPLAEAYTRHSHGLEQFLSQIRTEESLHILDVGGVTQSNVEFVTGLGHKLFSEAFLRPLDPSRSTAQDGDIAADQQAAEAFLSENLEFPAGWFDGVLLWDTLEFLPPPLLKATIERLHHVTKPGASLLAFFHADEKAVEVPSCSYRIHDAATLLLAHRQMRRPCQCFNNRSVEKLFQRFQSVKFFLARDHLREVIVRR